MLQLGTKKAINSRLAILKKEIEKRKREFLSAADEGGSVYVTAKELKFAATQFEWAINRIAELEERISKEEQKAAKDEE